MSYSMTKSLVINPKNMVVEEIESMKCIFVTTILLRLSKVTFSDHLLYCHKKLVTKYQFSCSVVRSNSSFAGPKIKWMISS